MPTPRPKLLILGTRGIPAAHGGFETFAERLALFLVARGWDVGVYCQRDVERVRNRVSLDRWKGIERITVEVAAKGPAGTLLFDALCVRDAAARRGTCLVLGYNGAVFLPYLRLRGRPVITNMDGIEWRRPKWGGAARAWFWVNEWIAAQTSQVLVADHPRIADHLATRRSRDAIVTIPYGGDPADAAPEGPVRALGLQPGRYLACIARIEPDNSIELIVRAFSRARRGVKLLVLGDVDPAKPYGRAVRAAAGDEVVFPGPIYDPAAVRAIRVHALAYLHGHTVGGTNPSLVEALWAGNAVIAHDNPFNRWTAGEAGLFFRDGDACAALIARAVERPESLDAARAMARVEARARFDWTAILKAYEGAFLALDGGTAEPARPAAAARLGQPS